MKVPRAKSDAPSAVTAPVPGWPVIGHAWAVRHLEASLERGRLSHAYLLTGIHGIGKTTLARALAARLECTREGGVQPCGECAACLKVRRGVHPDVRVVEAGPPGWKIDEDGPPPPRKLDRERRTLKIDQIRDLTQWLVETPFEGRWKIAIIRRFEETVEQAANALLKTLEEPPQHAMLILTAQNAMSLLPTIVSRCQRLNLRPLPMATVEEALREQWGVPGEKATLLARLARGRLGWAVRAAEDERILREREGALSQLEAALGEGHAERLTRAFDLSKEKETLPQILEEWMVWWRDVLLLSSQNGAPDEVAARLANVDRREELDRYAARYSPTQAQEALRALRQAQRYLEQNVNPRLVMDVLLLDLPGK